MIYRSYTSGDEQQIVNLWNECLTHDPINSNRFRNLVLLDANFDPNGLRLAFDQEKLVGCVYAVRRLLPMINTDLEPENGWITFFFVHPSYRENKVGKTLMHDAIVFLKSAGRKNVFFSSYAPNYFVPGIDETSYPEGYHFLQSQGFKILYSPVAMDRNLVNLSLTNETKQLIREREAEGYIFSIASDKDLYEIIQFANITFNPDWGRAIREGILRGLPLERVFVVRHKSKVVGFCIYGGYEGIPERFGPFGVDPSQQGKGLGKLLLNICLHQMKLESLHNAWFLWTGEQSSAGHLYKKTGFQITRRFHVMKLEID